MKEKIYLNVTESGYRYFTMGSEGHGRYSFKIWVAKDLVKEDKKGEYISLPMKGVDITRTKKGSLVLHSGNKNLFNFYVPCGYRGGASYTIEEPETFVDLPYYEYQSPRGNLGVGKGALVLVNSDGIIYSWERRGRLYGAPATGRTQIRLDGTEAELPEEKELEDLLGE